MPGDTSMNWSVSSVIVEVGGTATAAFTGDQPSKENLDTLLNGKATAEVSSGVVTFTGVSAGEVNIPPYSFVAPSVYSGNAITVSVTAPTEDESYLNKRGLAHFWENIDDIKQDKLTAGTNITISANNTISASQPTVGNATLTIQKNGTNVQTFTANATSNKTANITVPTVTSDLTNDSGFITTSALSGYLPLAGGTLTGKLTGTQIETGTAADNYFQAQKFRGQGDASSYYHAIDFGYAGHNQVDFYEYGSAWNFWRNTSATATTDTSNLALGITLNALKNKSYTYTFPNKTGTFALTSDIPSSITVDSALSTTSTNPVQNKVVTTELNSKADTSDMSTALAAKQDRLTAGAHINITGSTIKAVDYVHSEQPVSTSAVTPVVTGSMISNGTITADKLATGATLKLTLSTSDIGEGSALASNTLYGVYR